MIHRRTASLLLLLSVPVGYVAGSFIERTTSVASVVIQPLLVTKEMDCDRARSSEIDKVNRDLLKRIEVRDMLVAELLAGRTALSNVTARFLALNQERASDMDVIRMHFSGATDTEKTARSVIGYAEFQIRDCGAIQRALILARLEFELRQIVTQESS